MRQVLSLLQTRPCLPLQSADLNVWVPLSLAFAPQADRDHAESRVFGMHRVPIEMVTNTSDVAAELARLSVMGSSSADDDGASVLTSVLADCEPRGALSKRSAIVSTPGSASHWATDFADAAGTELDGTYGCSNNGVGPSVGGGTRGGEEREGACRGGSIGGGFAISLE